MRKSIQTGTITATGYSAESWRAATLQITKKIVETVYVR